MQTLLFLLAVLLAIPTFGVSLLLYFAYLIARGVMRANARMHYADTQQAFRAVEKQINKVHASSPHHINHTKYSDEFWHGLKKLARDEYTKFLCRKYRKT